MTSTTRVRYLYIHTEYIGTYLTLYVPSTVASRVHTFAIPSFRTVSPAAYLQTPSSPFSICIMYSVCTYSPSPSPSPASQQRTIETDENRRRGLLLVLPCLQPAACMSCRAAQQLIISYGVCTEYLTCCSLLALLWLNIAPAWAAFGRTRRRNTYQTRVCNAERRSRLIIEALRRQRVRVVESRWCQPIGDIQSKI